MLTNKMIYLITFINRFSSQITYAKNYLKINFPGKD